MIKLQLTILFLVIFTSFGICQKSDSLYKEILTKRIDFLELDNISDGYDSIQIRIWPNFHCSCISLGLPQLIVIKNRDNNWTGINYIIDTKTNDYIIADFDTFEFSPNNSWDSFLNDIKIQNILILEPITDSIYKNTIIADGYTDLIEIATKGSYKYIFLKVTRDYRDKFFQARTFCNLIDELEKNLKINAR